MSLRIQTLLRDEYRLAEARICKELLDIAQEIEKATKDPKSRQRVSIVLGQRQVAKLERVTGKKVAPETTIHAYPIMTCAKLDYFALAYEFPTP